ncbi:MAG: hypothetical protein MUC43_10730 [Pirellula sp.]|jgi:hypothetical protein|nr:hypothetical protein [Pirellula sp.]
MIVTLMGPDDLGCWFLTDSEGNAYEFIINHEDHLDAALLGWDRPIGIDDEEAIINALDWLVEHTGEDFTAPKIVVEYFEELYAEQE